MLCNEKRKEIEIFLNKNGYIFIDELCINKKPYIIIKDKFGYKYQVYYNSILKNHQPQFVSKHNPFSLENIIVWIKINNISFSLCDDNAYNSNMEKLKFHCHLCGYDFYTPWRRVEEGFGCRVCSGKQVTDKNCLAHVSPELVKDWSEKNRLTPSDVHAFSTKKAFWKCSICKNEWESVIQSRSNGKGCPFCSGRFPTKENNLKQYHPEILIEWDYERNGNPENYTPKSGKKVSWICYNCGNNWQATISNRVYGKNCPVCNFSSGEGKIYRNVFSFSKVEYQKRFLDCKYKKQLPFDFYLPDYNLCIEYHGIQHYEVIGFFGGQKAFEELQYRDSIKQQYCYDNNIPLLIIPYWDFDRIEEILDETLKNLE